MSRPVAPLERVAEIAPREVPDEVGVLAVPGSIRPHHVRDLADARGRRAPAGDALRRVRARQVGDQEEEE